MNTTIEKILKVYPHPNADKLELVKVLGYQCVVPKDKYKEGDYIIYIRPDSVLPYNRDWATEFLKYAPKRVKAIKLRDEWSEGIIVDLEKVKYDIPDIYYDIVNNIKRKDNIDPIVLGVCVDDALRIKHYEPPVPQDLACKKMGLPFNIPKTDEERWENIEDKLPYGDFVDITLKIDGMSCSYYYKYDTKEFGVLSRSMELKEECSNNYTSHIGKIFDKQGFIDYCEKNKVSICLRGEVYGNGIQSMEINPHSKLPKGIMFFSVYLIDEHRYANKGEKFYYRNVCEELDLPQVPLISSDVELTKSVIDTYSSILITFCLSKYGLKENSTFEGVVIKHSKGSFKVINKYYDSKK